MQPSQTPAHRSAVHFFLLFLHNLTPTPNLTPTQRPLHRFANQASETYTYMHTQPLQTDQATVWVTLQQDHPNLVTMCTNTRKLGPTQSQKICASEVYLKIESDNLSGCWKLRLLPTASTSPVAARRGEEKDAFLVPQQGERQERHTKKARVGVWFGKHRVPSNQNSSSSRIRLFITKRASVV